MKNQSVKSGLDILQDSKLAAVSGARVGILANQASVDCNLNHIADIFAGDPSIKIVRLFAPEHGFRGTEQDMALVKDERDPKTNVEIVSLYGSSVQSLQPDKKLLEDLDVIVVDLPDIGTRYYTFAQTLGLVMQTAAQTKTKVLVIDRPNPINGIAIEGSYLHPHCRSFCGYAPVPNRHGLTLGELAHLMNEGFSVAHSTIPAIGCTLEVLKARGWARKQYFDETGLPWVLPSPNMPTLDTAIVYPGACLFEALTASEGRGTTRPFELLGAPGVDSDAWIDATLALGIALDGFHLRPTSFIPSFQKHVGFTCSGLQIHITNRDTFKPYRLGLALLIALHRLDPRAGSLRTKAYEFVDTVPAIDLLFGSSLLREVIQNKATIHQLTDELIACENEFASARSPYLLY